MSEQQEKVKRKKRKYKKLQEYAIKYVNVVIKKLKETNTRDKTPQENIENIVIFIFIIGTFQFY